MDVFTLIYSVTSYSIQTSQPSGTLGTTFSSSIGFKVKHNKKNTDFKSVKLPKGFQKYPTNSSYK